MGRVWLFLLIGLMSCGTAFAAEPPVQRPALTPDQTEFFEKKIRPILVKHCYQCHSESARTKQQLKGSLLLDRRDGLLEGGDSGPAVVPGKPDETPLLAALRYESLKMPPAGKLPAGVIADFEAWVKMGAPDPRTGDHSATPAGIDVEAGRRHWSYQPLRRPGLPEVRQRHWPVTAIDRFILHGLEAQRLQPASDAGQLKLVRRIYFDLTGLPPTTNQIDEFLNDTRDDAYARLVDRLLASPQFGERWGRHWLDVVRYAESVTLRGFILPEAWRYRDYVIDRFNADQPYDQFLREQVAGDLLPASTLIERQRQCVATTFLTLGNHVLEEQDKAQLRMDVVDEQLDVITKGFLAQTVTCARCHDHKFDPIPTKDYYALAGILRNTQSLEHANVSKWLELPLPLQPALEQQFQKVEASVADLTSRLSTEKELAKKLAAAAGTNAGAAVDVVAAKELPGIVIDDVQAKKVGEWTLSQFTKRYIGDGYLHDVDNGKGTKTLTFQPDLPKAGVYEVRFAYTPGSNRTSAAPVTIFSADGEKTVQVDEQQAPPIEGRFVSLGKFRFELNGAGFVIVSNEGTRGHVIADAVQFLPVDAAAPSPDATAEATRDDQPARAELQISKRRIKDLERQLKELSAASLQRPKFMSVRDEQKVEDCAVHVRGTVHNLGPIVPRGFLTVVRQGPPSTFPADQSGRRELGDWLASPANPLPARVMANRIWHWLLGSGLVRTVDNFGTTGESPSHPELLDYLATGFVDQGWSVKSLVREIVLSRTYRLSSVASAELMAQDPENRLFGRANRRRMDAECLLDSMLLVGGNLELQSGGSTIKPEAAADFGYQFKLNRRAIYWPVLRNSLPELFEVFDFPDPSMVVGRRNTSTVAPQALFLMNSPFVGEQSRLAMRCLLRDSPTDDAARIDLAFRRILGRLPNENERNAALDYVRIEASAPADERVNRWAQLVQALFGTVDFRYVD